MPPSSRAHEERGYTVPAFLGRDQRSMRTHLFLMHAVYTETTLTAPELTECHNWVSGIDDGGAFPHTHSDPEPAAEWSWDE